MRSCPLLRWTRWKIHAAGLAESYLCLRCQRAPEITEQRLWECPAGAAARRALLEKLPQLVPADLPNCLRRCGLIPSDFVVAGRFNALTVTHYLLGQVRAATTAHVQTRELEEALGPRP